MSEETIEGIVAQIVSDRELILNRGTADGVEAGMYFKILDPATVDVRDPKTGEILGSIMRVKIVVQAVDVAERITIAQTFRTKEVNIGGSGVSILGGLMTPPKYVAQVETLRRGPDQPEPIGEKESIIKVGDPFELATRAEADAARSVALWREPLAGEEIAEPADD
jgi:hypothetical protein